MPGIDPRYKPVISRINELCRLPDDLYCFKILKTKTLGRCCENNSSNRIVLYLVSQWDFKQLNSGSTTKFKMIIIQVLFTTSGSSSVTLVSGITYFWRQDLCLSTHRRWGLCSPNSPSHSCTRSAWWAATEKRKQCPIRKITRHYASCDETDSRHYYKLSVITECAVVLLITYADEAFLTSRQSLSNSIISKLGTRILIIVFTTAIHKILIRNHL